MTDATTTETDYIQENASWLYGPLFDVDRLLRKMRKLLKDVEFDTLVGSGLSGSLIVPIAARSMRKNLMIVRKDDNSHSYARAEGRLGRRWIFVDDFVSSGETFGRVVERILITAAARGHQTSFVGAYLYAYDEGQPAFLGMNKIRSMEWYPRIPKTADKVKTLYPCQVWLDSPTVPWGA